MYCLKHNDQPVQNFPKILKLRGSVSWDLHDEQLQLRTGGWDDFDDAPG
jgi:hypothetical protein